MTKDQGKMHLKIDGIYAVNLVEGLAAKIEVWESQAASDPLDRQARYLRGQVRDNWSHRR
jgi:hypothetical protein